MRILHVYRTYFPDTQGGLEEAIRQICRATAPHGASHTIFTVSGRPQPARLARPEAEVVRVRRWFEVASCDFATPAGALAFARLAREHDLVHYHLPWPFADMLHLGLRIGRPAVATYQSDIVRQQLLGAAYRPLMRRFLGSLQAVVATSPDYVRSSQMLRDVADRVVVIPNTIDDASYPQPAPGALEAWRARLGPTFFLFVGVLRYYKGLQHLVEAARGSPYPVVIAGEGPEGAALRRLAADAPSVRFLGRVSNEEKVALMRACSAIVFPSHLRSEAFGMTLLEGAMYGRPLVSCDIGTGTSYVNEHGCTGLVVPPCDPAALAAAMRQLAQDPGAAEAMGQAARARYERLFGPGVVGRAYARLYAGALEGGRSMQCNPIPMAEPPGREAPG